MSSDTNGGQQRHPAQNQLNVFALVIYLPDPLARFLDDLRRELAPGCNPHAHVSVLPPRPLSVEWRVASGQVRSLTDAWSPFEIELVNVARFQATDVIYLELGAGAEEVRRMHGAMNSGPLHFEEPYAYHPHVTLAQELKQQDVGPAYDLAIRRWEEYRGRRSFLADRAVFVQNTVPNCWVDLADYSLGAVTVP